MADTFRAMCAELLRRWDAANGDHDLIDVADAMDRARTLLAQPVAEGVTDEELLEAFDEEFAEFFGSSDGFGTSAISRSKWTKVARAVLARYAYPTPQPPADGEVGELVAWLRAFANGERHEGRPATAQSLARTADILQRFASPACYVISPSPEALASLKAAGHGIIEALPAERTALVPLAQPVAVSERLPEPKDVNEDGEVWIIEEGYSYALGDTGDYDWEPHKIVLRPIGQFDEKYGRTWLPFNALPLPQGNDN